MINFPKIVLKKIEDISKIIFLSEKNESLKKIIISSLLEGDNGEEIQSKISADYKKLIDDEPSIFIPTFNYSSSSTNNAIKNLSEAIENFDGQTKASFTKLSEVSESLAQKETIMQRIAELNDAGLNIFIGEQHLHHSTANIFLIDDFNIPKIKLTCVAKPVRLIILLPNFECYLNYSLS